MRNFFILLLFATLLQANDVDVEIDNLLDNIEKKTDLSSKTKLENGGITTIYTRDDIIRMQAKNLKDILKSTYPFGYKENRYGLADPFYLGTAHPFMSSSIRVYVDNQELTTGLYGSGLILYGDMEIGFVDHIEVYTGNPTYEFSTEPTYILIKLYSKKAYKDGGSKLTLSGGNFGDSFSSLYNSSELDNNWAYFAYASHGNDKREKYSSHTTELSRDKTNSRLFASFYNDNNRIIIDGGSKKRDTFMDQSLDATPLAGNVENDYLHVGYDGNSHNFSYLLSRDKINSRLFASFYNDNNRIIIDGGSRKRDTFIDQSMDATPLDGSVENDYLHVGYDGNSHNFSYLLSYDMFNTRSKFLDDVTPLAVLNYTYPVASLNTNSKSYVLSGELKYQYKTKSNKLITGVKYRYKGFKYDTLSRNGVELPRTGHTKQTNTTAFIENQYSFMQNSILTTGLSASKVRNNNSVQNDDLYMYRVGHTYTTENIVMKTIYSHMELSLDPYLVNSYGIYITPGKKDKTRQDTFMENIIYEKDNNKYELLFSSLYTKNQLLPDAQTGSLDNYDKTIKILSFLGMWTHHYNRYDKLYATLSYGKIYNLPSSVDSVKQYTVILRSLNTYKKFDIFNELLYSRTDDNDKNYYDYSAGVIYHHTKDLSLSLKATNILNKAQEVEYSRVSPTTFQKEESLSIPTIDRHIMLIMEYLF